MLAWIKTTEKLWQGFCTSKSSHFKQIRAVDEVGSLENGDVGERREEEKKQTKKLCN